MEQSGKKLPLKPLPFWNGYMITQYTASNFPIQQPEAAESTKTPRLSGDASRDRRSDEGPDSPTFAAKGSFGITGADIKRYKDGKKTGRNMFKF